MRWQAAAAAYESLLGELNEERAAALARIAGRLDSLIGQLHDARGRLAALRGAERTRELARYADLRRAADLQRWYLEVQRESLGLRQHRHLDELYTIPGPIEDSHPR